MNSILYIVATPIGNMQDITLRSLEILKSVDFIISEDTRETLKLLNFFNIKKKQISYRDENHFKVYSKILSLLKSGYSLALVSDRGTPLISDPGFKLVREVLKEGYKVESLPGPSSILTALVLSGLPTDKFLFLGFLPKTSQLRHKYLSKYGNLDATLILFEAPSRIIPVLNDIQATLGNRNVCIARELTKLNEEVYRFNLQDLEHQKIDLRGEFVILISKEGL